ncbi:MAG: protein-export chaperone SecB [Rhodospirillaceae bacterium]|nr:protein-export chaperone SecB [Rhodospirillaceae bacterium]
MTDTTTTTPPPGAAAAGLARPSIIISAQYLRDLSFENPSAPETLTPGNTIPQVKVNVDVKTRALAENRYEVTLNIKGESDIGDKKAFIVELSYAGVVGVENASREQVGPMLLIEAPRQLFPFARQIIADAVRNGGYPPLLIQPIDFVELFRRQVEAAQRVRAQGAAPAGDGAAGPATPTA